jgi:broad specificity polyphosphatase/5'/3'-nucleotidase SurE
LKVIAPDAKWLIAGINPGANLGSDVYNSGTVAAAREAAILGYRAIAVSQYIAKDQKVDWSVTGDHACPVLQMLISRDLSKGHFWNVNLPHPIRKNSKLAYEFCELDTLPHNYVYSRSGNELIYVGTIHERPRDPGKDVAVCFDEGRIAITCLAVELAAARWDAVASFEVDELVAGLAIAGAVLVHIDRWIFLFAFVAFDGEAGRVVFCGDIFAYRYQLLIEAGTVHQHTP